MSEEKVLYGFSGYYPKMAAVKAIEKAELCTHIIHHKGMSVDCFPVPEVKVFGCNKLGEKLDVKIECPICKRDMPETAKEIKFMIAEENNLLACKHNFNPEKD